MSAVTIVIVDDEPILLRSLVRILGDRYNVITFDTAASALAFLFLQPDTPCDAILTDLSLPGCSGMKLYEKILATRPELGGRVIFMTGSDPSPEAVSFVDAHRARVLLKPFSHDELLAMLRQIVSR